MTSFRRWFWGRFGRHNHIAPLPEQSNCHVVWPDPDVAHKEHLESDLPGGIA